MFHEDDDPMYDLMARYDYYREAGFDTGDLEGDPADNEPVGEPIVVAAPMVEERQWEDDDIPF